MLVCSTHGPRVRTRMSQIRVRATRTRAIALGAILMLVTALAATIVVPNAHAATSLKADVAVVGDWNSGRQVDVTVTNHGNTAVTGWSVTLTVPSGSNVTTFWSALHSASGSSNTFSPVGWNATINPGASVTFGFLISGPGGVTGCSIDGRPCAGGSQPAPTATLPATTNPPATANPANTSNPTTCHPAWSRSQVYVGGDEVTHNGTNWRAGWWTQGEEPGTTGEWGVWRALGDCGTTTPTEPPPTTEPPADGTPIEVHGQLSVCETKLCDQNGDPIQLRGMSTHGIQWFDQCYTDQAFDVLANDWQADVVRLSMYIQEGGYETDPVRFTNRMHQLIDLATAKGMYVIVDWHMLTPGDPLYNLDRAKTFFNEIAQRHANKTNLLYEIANEPNRVDWANVKSYADQVIPVIRAHDSDAVVLVGTTGWSSLGLSHGTSYHEIINNPVNADNIMYVFHFYAASHDQLYINALSDASLVVPIFVTEFGTQDHAGEGANDFTRSQQYLDLMAERQISWVNWNYADDHRSGSVFNVGTCSSGIQPGTSQLKEAGVWIRNQLRNGD